MTRTDPCRALERGILAAKKILATTFLESNRLANPVPEEEKLGSPYPARSLHLDMADSR